MKRKAIKGFIIAMILVGLLPVPVNAAAPSLTAENHSNWQDRISNWPDYALRFIDWLTLNSSMDGMLADVTKAEYIDGAYVHEVRTVTDTFTIPLDGIDDINQAVSERIKSIAEANFKEINSFIFTAYSVFYKDNPQLFWLSGECLLNYTVSCEYVLDEEKCDAAYTQVIYFGLQKDDHDVRNAGYTDSGSVRKATAEFEIQLADILSGCSDMNSGYEQIKYLNKWLTEHNDYNIAPEAEYTAADSRASISALRGSTGEQGPVCSGYARAFKVLCDRLEIPCVIVNGEADNGTGSQLHEWNYVQMEDQKWYAVDVTWNDPRVAGNSNAKSGKENEAYLLVGSSTVINGKAFEASHIVNNYIHEDGEPLNNGPKLSEESYKFDKRNAVRLYTGYKWSRAGVFHYYQNGKLQYRVINHISLK